MKKNKKIIIAVIVAIVVITLITVLTLVLTGKTENIFNTEKKETEEKITKMLENDYAKIEVNHTSYEEGYLIIEYDITSKVGSEYFDKCSDNIDGLGYYLERTVILNGEELEDTDNSMQFAERVSETEAKVYDFIEVEENNIKSDTKIEIKIYDTDDIYTEVEDNINYTDDTEEYDETIDEAEDLEENNETDEEITDEVNEDNYEEVEGEYIEGTDEDIIDEETIEDISEEDISAEEEKYNEDEYEDEIVNDYEGLLLGKITLNITKDEITKETSKTEIPNSSYEYEDLKITKTDLIETDCGKFLIIASEIKNVTEEDIFGEDADITNIELNLQDETGNTITASKESGYQIILEDGTDWVDSDAETFSNATLKFKTIVSLNNQEEINKLKILPILPQYYETTEEELNSKNWNKIADEKYEATSDYGCNVTITKIEQKDGNINFYYEATGLITEAENFIIVRNTQKGDYTICNNRRITTSGERIMIFEMDDPETDEEFKYLDNIENLEFAIFEGIKVATIGEGITIEL